MPHLLVHMTRKFKSNLEAQFYKAHNLPYETSKLKYVLTHTYTPDWQVSPTAFIETKGAMCSADRTKIKECLKQHPHVRILMAFQVPQKRLSKTSKTTYAGWCDRHGVEWCKWDDTVFICSWIRTHRPTTP